MTILFIAAAVCFQSDSGTIRRKIYCSCIGVFIILVIVLSVLCFFGYGENVGDYLAVSIGTLVGYFIASVMRKG